ncbi:MAG: hypothetical protein EBQ96_09460 [Proteobacteria bacterium]|nr:hypothetical protein [Pseudomonadota bacterium]
MALQGITSVGSNNASGNGAPRREQGGRSFADLYQQALKARTNDNSPSAPSVDPKAVENQKYIETLHERVDTLRGEILARVIQTAQAPAKVDPVKVTEDITRLSVRLDKLKSKLETEEARLSGKLIDINV